jgi:methionyl-tRNA formyltransferase
MRDLRVAFLGMNGLFTLAPLRAVERRYRLVGIVEAAAPSPASSPTRGMEAQSPHLEHFARRRRLPHFVLKRGGPRATQFLQALRPDIMCVASFSQLLRPEEFQIPPLGTINLHPSALPKYRGPNPYFWQHHEMDLDGAVTIHFVDEGIDTGDVLLQDHFPIPLGATYREVSLRSLRIGTASMIRAVELLAGGLATRWPQRHLPCPLYARFVESPHHLVQWDAWPLERVWHFLRGTHDKWPFLPLPDSAGRWVIGPMRREAPAQAPGTVSRDEDGYYVAHAQGKIRLDLISPPSRPMTLLRRQARRIREAIRWR